MTKLALLVLVVAIMSGMALAEDEAEGKAAGGALLGLVRLKKAIFWDPLVAVLEIGAQVVILIALIKFVASLKHTLDAIKGTDYDYAYYPAPAYESYDGSGGSSYASTGASGSYSKKKRSLPSSIMDLPFIQRLSAKVHEAIESFDS